MLGEDNGGATEEVTTMLRHKVVYIKQSAIYSYRKQSALLASNTRIFYFVLMSKNCFNLCQN